MSLNDLESLISLLRRTGVLEYRDQHLTVVLGPPPPIEPAPLVIPTPDPDDEKEGAW